MDDGSVIVTELQTGRLVRVQPDGAKDVVAELGGSANGAAVGPDGMLMCATLAEEIGMDAITLNYANITDAKKMSGLRLVLGEYAVPGPWREACKGFFYVKKFRIRLLRRHR